MMKTRTLGDGLTVSALGIGCMPMSEGRLNYGKPDETEAVATIHAAIDRGVTFFDTAEVYGPHSNEELLGHAIKGRRDGLVIATKFGFIKPDGSMGVDSSPANIRRACEGSLKRLGIETIDLLYQHRVDPGTPIEDTVGAVADLIKEGKVRHIGLSEAGAGTLRKAAAEHPIAALQSEYSLWERGVEEEILPVARELGIAFVPYSPLGRGFLTGQVTRPEDMDEKDYRRNDPRYQGDNFATNMAMVDVISTIADAHGVSAAQIALAWLLAQGPDIVPIPGTKRRATMNDSISAADVTLTNEDLAMLDQAAPRDGTAGPRYGEQMMKMVRL